MSEIFAVSLKVLFLYFKNPKGNKGGKRCPGFMVSEGKKNDIGPFTVTVYAKNTPHLFL